MSASRPSSPSQTCLPLAGRASRSPRAFRSINTALSTRRTWRQACRANGSAADAEDQEVGQAADDEDVGREAQADPASLPQHYPQLHRQSPSRPPQAQISQDAHAFRRSRSDNPTDFGPLDWEQERIQEEDEESSRRESASTASSLSPDKGGGRKESLTRAELPTTARSGSRRSHGRNHKLSPDTRGMAAELAATTNPARARSTGAARPLRGMTALTT